MFLDPETFRPKRRERERQYLDEWGLPLEDCYLTSDEPTMEIMMRLMKTQLSSNSESPEEQYVEQLMEVKMNKLEATKIDPNKCNDLVIKIWLHDTKPLIWRQFKVSSGVTLFTLADKVRDDFLFLVFPRHLAFRNCEPNIC